VSERDAMATCFYGVGLVVGAVGAALTSWPVAVAVGVAFAVLGYCAPQPESGGER
jgi:hypothetical protein